MFVKEEERHMLQPLERKLKGRDWIGLVGCKGPCCLPICGWDMRCGRLVAPISTLNSAAVQDFAYLCQDG